MNERRFWVVMLVLLLGGCGGLTQHERASRVLIPALELPDGSVSAKSAAAAVASPDLLAIDSEMEDFLDVYVRSARIQRQRLNLLHQALRSRAIVGLEYDEQANGAAIETFHRARANCLSYATVFVALARATGLDAHFQVVATKPEWDRRGDRLAVALHVNAVVNLKGGERFEVDIDPLTRSRIVGTQIINDNEALALFHNNVGMELFLNGDSEGGYRHMSRALQLYPELDYLWANIGAIYRSNDQNEDAESSYRTALLFDPRSRTALNNLVVLYQTLGENERAEEIVQRISAHRERNPYYHFQLAETADDEGDYELAVDHLREAISRKDSDAEFYYLMGKVLHKATRLDESVQSLQLAIEKAEMYGQREQIRNYMESVLGEMAM
ncbi:MAG: Flp pilus assembly protein TadD [Halieaceae bacterium]|jgi:Flp pilus assembly protein TadD